MDLANVKYLSLDWGQVLNVTFGGERTTSQ